MEKIENKQRERYFLVEHLEDAFFNWCLYEYTQMVLTLNNTYHPFPTQTKNTLIFTNFPPTGYDNKISEDTEVVQESVKNLHEFKELIKNLNASVIFSSVSIVSHVKQQDLQLSTNDEIHTDNIIKELKLDNICMMDMRGPKQLEPSDDDQFSLYVFGGILGDHPPRDRGKFLRELNFGLRQLGAKQMTTDTAIHVTKKVVIDKVPFECLNFVEKPEFPFDLQRTSQFHLNIETPLGDDEQDGVKYNRLYCMYKNIPKTEWEKVKDSHKDPFIEEKGAEEGDWAFDCRSKKWNGEPLSHELTDMEFRYLVDPFSEYKFKGKNMKNFPLIDERLLDLIYL